MKMVVAVSAACDVALVWWFVTTKTISMFDMLWVAWCVIGHIAIYVAAVTRSPSARTALCEFADVALWIAMFSAILLRNQRLFYMAMTVLVVVCGLYLTNDNKCLLTGRRWDTLVFLEHRWMGTDIQQRPYGS